MSDADIIYHRIQFYNYLPLPFTCIAKSEALIATARNDGSIELYDESRNFFMVSRIPPSVFKSVEALGWIGSRLFASGALGTLHEVDILNSTSKDSLLLTGAAVSRCLITSGENVIVGNDEGHISLFSTYPKLAILHTFQQLTGRILSLACPPTKHWVAASTSAGILIVYSYTPHASDVVHVLSFESKETSAWSLLFTNDYTLIVGDNKGCVNVWDVNVGSVLFTFAGHSGHVLALTSSLDGNTVYSGGSDGRVRKLEFNYMDGSSRWELGGTLHGCRRDIRGLAFITGKHFDPGSHYNNSDSRFESHRILAVGHDARLQLLACEATESGLDALANAHKTLACQVGQISDNPDRAMRHVAALPFWSPSCTPFRPQPIHFVSRARQVDPATKIWDRLCLLHYPDHLSIVRLAVPEKLVSMKCKSRLVRMLEGAYKLADIYPRKGMDVIASTFSHCGKYVAYSDGDRSRVLELCVSMEDKYIIPSVQVRRIHWDHSKNLGEKMPKRCRTHASSHDTTHDPHLSHNLAANTSSSETDTDTQDELSCSAITNFFALDQPPSDSAVKPKSSIHHTDSFVMNENATSQMASGTTSLPSSYLLEFTADTTKLILVTRISNEVICFNLESGTEQWRFQLDSESNITFRAFHLTLSKRLSSVGYVFAIGCSDGRVRLYSVNSGKHIFTFGCLPSASGHPPFPVTSCFARDGGDHMSLSILYTNGQITEWHLHFISKSHTHSDAPSLIVEATLDSWLSQFWKANQRDICQHLGVFHSMCYFNNNTWLLASDRYLVLLTKNKKYFHGMIPQLVYEKSPKKSDNCLRIAKMFESTIQTTCLMKNELAAVCLCESALSYNLTAPLKRKLFGT